VAQTRKQPANVGRCWTLWAGGTWVGTVRNTTLRITGEMAEIMADLRSWLDYHGCNPVFASSFSAQPPDTIVNSVDFGEDHMAELFKP